MDSSLKIIPVVYMGGCCGDIVTTLLDPTDSQFNTVLKKMKLPMDRQKLKKSYLFADDSEKDLYLKEVEQKYTSIPSHDIDYHVNRDHWFIGISVKNKTTAIWASERFKNVHRPEVWESVKKGCGITSVDEYADLMLHYGRMIESKTPNILMLEDIKSGQAITPLENLTGMTISEKSRHIYQNWQDLVNGCLFV